MEGITGIFAREIPDVGVVQVGMASGRVVSVSFPAAADADADDGCSVLDRIEAYFTDGSVPDGDPLTDPPIALTLPTDLRAVLERLRSVPAGRSVGVDDLARMTPALDDDADGRETVRAALAENPVPLLVPDHRVRDADGATPSAVAARCRRIEGI
ncbi:MGMT family protein [Halovivax sp.]|uniref:MGMT family protein n=1 Tax=Halovivax sp. TaxID=1935978 RepID=UPI0025C3F28D|nr:MGMT family protein [Halovivax sp.]